MLIARPDIQLVVRINVLQLPACQPIYVRAYFDFSIYVAADPVLIAQWTLERFGILLDTAFTDPANTTYQTAIGNRAAAFAMARQVWQAVNLCNLCEYILPTCNRADVILHKTMRHKIAQVS